MSSDLLNGNRLDSHRNEYVEEIDYPTVKKTFLDRISLPGVLVVVGCMVLVVLLSFLFVRLQTSGQRTRMVALEDRIEFLENRLLNIDGIPELGSQMDAQGKRLDGLNSRINRMEASMPAIIDQIKNELDTLQKKTAVTKSVTPTQPKTVTAPTPSVSTQKPTQPVYHTVRKGETLYSISRKYKDRYGLSMDKIRKINNLGPNSAIYSGQKIIVGP